MKKHLLLILLCVFIKVDEVFAANISMCKYNISTTYESYFVSNANLISSNTTSQTLEIKYGDSGYVISIPNQCSFFNSSWNCSKTKEYSYADFNKMELDNNHVEMGDDAKKSFLNGTCPKLGYYDLKSALQNQAGYDEMCFGSICGTYKGGTNSGNRFNLYELQSDQGIGGRIIATSTNTFDLVSSLTKVATAAGKNKLDQYNVDKNVPYESNKVCQEYKNTEKFSQNLYNMAATEAKVKVFADSTLSGASQTVKEKIWTFVKSENNVGTAFVSKDKLEKIDNDCRSLLASSDLTDKEKKDQQNELDQALTRTVDDLIEFYTNNLGYTFSGDFSGDEDCIGFLGNPRLTGSPAYYLQLLLNLFKYAAVILALVLSIVDYVKATVSQDKDLLKKATLSATKRVIFAVLIFFLPALINFVMGLLGAFTTCGIE